MANVRFLRVLDLVLYGVVLTLAVCLGAGPVIYLISSSLTGLKWLLFLVGSFGIAVGAWKMRPKPAWKENPRLSVSDSSGEGRFQGIVDSVLPRVLLPEQQFSDGMKLFVGSIFMLVVSFLLEKVFGVPG